MSVWKNIKQRLIAFVLGVILTIAGLIMLYYDFFGKHVNSYSSTTEYSIAAFFIGIALLAIAFSKKKETGEGPGVSSK